METFIGVVIILVIAAMLVPEVLVLIVVIPMVVTYEFIKDALEIIFRDRKDKTDTHDPQ